MSINPQQFAHDEAWILFRLNDAPVETKADGDFHVYAIMDVATGLIHGMEFSASCSDKISEFEAKKLLNSAQNKAGSFPKQLYVDEAAQYASVKRAASNLGIKTTPEHGKNLDPITKEARVGFNAHVGRGHR